MYCSVYKIGGLAHLSCRNAIADGVKTCIMCDGVGLESYPDPVPTCMCGRPVNHPGTCSEKQAFFDAHREPNSAEMEFIQNLLNGMKPVDALKSSSLANTRAPVQKADRLMGLPHIKRYIGSVLDKHGATDDKIAKTISEGLEATDVQIRMEKSVDGDGNKVEKAVTLDRPDWNARARFAELAIRTKGYMDKEDDGARAPTKVTVISRHSRSKKSDDDEDVVGIKVEVGGAG